MERAKNIMLELIRIELCGEKRYEGLCNSLDEDTIKSILSLSKAHDLAHIIAHALEKAGALPEGAIGENAKKQKMLAMYRYVGFFRALPEIKATLEEAKIPFIVLKGSILRKYYPESWMRTSSDIDVLIREEDVERAREVIESELKYKTTSRNAHEIGMFSESGVHLELHRTLIEADEFLSFEKVLSDVWNYTEKEEQYEYSLLLSDDMFYYYHIAHMAKHYMHGGCGIRPFMDLFLLRTNDKDTSDKRKKLLAKGGLARFAEVAEALSRVWFCGDVHTETTKAMENYIVGAGVYGTQENYVAIQQSKSGNRFKYVLSRIWLPYDRLRHYYPSLNGKKALLPFYEFRRWMKLVFSKTTRRRSINEMKASGTLDTGYAKSITAHMKDLGL